MSISFLHYKTAIGIPSKCSVEERMMIKMIALGILNAVLVIVAYLAIGNVLHSLTGEYIDQVNMSSILTVTACIVILAGTTIVEEAVDGQPNLRQRGCVSRHDRHCGGRNGSRRALHSRRY
jgi:hypothetical protein